MTATATGDLEAQRQLLRARARSHRAELIASIRALREPALTVNRIGSTLRGAAPMLPYAIAAIGVAVVALQLRRGRLRPFVLAAAAIDAWQVWSLLRPRPSRGSPAIRRPGPGTHKEQYP